MNILADFVHVANVQVNGDLLRATLSPCRESVVYQAHFPGNPVTPGVLMIGIVVELLKKYFNRSIQLRRAKNVKFLSIMTPDDIEGVTVEITSSPKGIVSGVFQKGETIYAKMKIEIDFMQ